MIKLFLDKPLAFRQIDTPLAFMSDFPCRAGLVENGSRAAFSAQVSIGTIAICKTCFVTSQ
jgi:hypothetical protein